MELIIIYAVITLILSRLFEVIGLLVIDKFKSLLQKMKTKKNIFK